MSDPVNDPISTSSILIGAIGVLTAILGWLGRRQVSRIDHLERNAIDRSEYNDTIKTLREEIRGGHEKTQTLIIDLYKNQNHHNK